MFNTLKMGLQQEEVVLSEVNFECLRCARFPIFLFLFFKKKHFAESIRQVKKKLNIDLKLLTFDWHSNLKQLGKQFFFSKIENLHKKKILVHERHRTSNQWTLVSIEKSC